MKWIFTFYSDSVDTKKAKLRSVNIYGSESMETSNETMSCKLYSDDNTRCKIGNN